MLVCLLAVWYGIFVLVGTGYRKTRYRGFALFSLSFSFFHFHAYPRTQTHPLSSSHTNASSHEISHHRCRSKLQSETHQPMAIAVNSMPYVTTGLLLAYHKFTSLVTIFSHLRLNEPHQRRLLDLLHLLIITTPPLAIIDQGRQPWPGSLAASRYHHAHLQADRTTHLASSSWGGHIYSLVRYVAWRHDELHLLQGHWLGHFLASILRRFLCEGCRIVHLDALYNFTFVLVP